MVPPASSHSVVVTLSQIEFDNKMASVSEPSAAIHVVESNPEHEGGYISPPFFCRNILFTPIGIDVVEKLLKVMFLVRPFSCIVRLLLVVMGKLVVSLYVRTISIIWDLNAQLPPFASQKFFDVGSTAVQVPKAQVQLALVHTDSNNTVLVSHGVVRCSV